jgi:hypothetical protein
MAAEGRRTPFKGKSTPPFARHTYTSCVHLWYRSWAKRCENCLASSLSPSLQRLEALHDKEG